MRRWTAWLFAGVIGWTSAYARAEEGTESAIHALIRSFHAAEQAYDPGALAKLISGNYVEVSPAGEVDEHDRFLGFYTPDKKVEWPPMTLEEEQVRVMGDTAVEIAKVSYAMKAPDGSARSMEFRASYVAHRENGVWKLIGAQFSQIRPVPPAAAK